MTTAQDRGPVFDGVKIGRPATGALIDAGYRTIADLPENLGELLPLHGVGPRAVRLLEAARGGATGRHSCAEGRAGVSRSGGGRGRATVGGAVPPGLR